mgnify:CR=1 FL=1
MSCGLSEECLFILNVFYKGRNFKIDAGYHSKKLKKIFIKRFGQRTTVSFENAIHLLIINGYITEIKKKEIKYYISNRKLSIIALDAHGYSVVGGRLRRL